MSLITAEAFGTRTEELSGHARLEDQPTFSVDRQLDLLAELQLLRAAAAQHPESISVLRHLFAEELLGVLAHLDPDTLTPLLLSQMKALTTKHLQLLNAATAGCTENGQSTTPELLTETTNLERLCIYRGDYKLVFNRMMMQIEVTRPADNFSGIIQLTLKERAMLTLLWETFEKNGTNSTRVLSKVEIYEAITNDEYIVVDSNNVEVVVRRAREKIEEYLRLAHDTDTCLVPVIQTVRGVGYHFIPAVITSKHITEKDVTAFQKRNSKKSSGNTKLVIAYKNACSG